MIEVKYGNEKDKKILQFLKDEGSSSAKEIGKGKEILRTEVDRRLVTLAKFDLVERGEKEELVDPFNWGITDKGEEWLEVKKQ